MMDRRAMQTYNDNIITHFKLLSKLLQKTGIVFQVVSHQTLISQIHERAILTSDFLNSRIVMDPHGK